MWRMGVPVATPISAGDGCSALGSLVCGQDYRSRCEKQVREFLGAPYAISANSGRASLFLVLRAMASSSIRDEVIIPAYACPSVARAVIKAHLKPVLCDVGPSGSGLDTTRLRQLLNGRTLAVVVAYLYGYPCDITAVLHVARNAGALVIEDAAQSFGAKWQGRYVGTLADAGIFSFGFSKVLWCINGGLAVTSDARLAQLLGSGFENQAEISKLQQTVDIAKLAFFGLLLRSHHLGPLNMLWERVLRGRNDCEDFDARRPASNHYAVLLTLLKRFDQITQVRRRNALHLIERLVKFDGIELPQMPSESEPVFLRLPVIAQTSHLKEELRSRLRVLGINTSAMYSRPSYEALCQMAVRKSKCSQAEYLCDRMLNLPTHAFVRGSDLKNMDAVFRSVLNSRSVHSPGIALGQVGVNI